MAMKRILGGLILAIFVTSLTGCIIYERRRYAGPYGYRSDYAYRAHAGD